MDTIHRVLGFVVVGALFGVFLIGLGLRIAGRDEAPPWFWVVEHYVENVLLVQVVVGVVLFAVLGRRVVGGPLIWFHYLYGSIFPAIAIIGGRINGLRRETREYVGITWGALIAWGLTFRALLTGLGIG